MRQIGTGVIPAAIVGLLTSLGWWIALAIGMLMVASSFAAEHLGARAGLGGRLRLAVGNSGEFDKLDVADPPQDQVDGVTRTLQGMGQQAPEHWVRLRKTVRVTNRSRKREARACRAAIVEIAPHAGQDTLPARLVWNDTHNETCDIPPGGSAYAVVWEAFTGLGNRAMLRPQRPLVSLTLEETAEIRVVAWGEDLKATSRSLTLSGLTGNHGFPVAQAKPMRPHLPRRERGGRGEPSQAAMNAARDVMKDMGIWPPLWKRLLEWIKL